VKELKEGYIEVTGIVIELLPSAVFKVKVLNENNEETNHILTAHTSGRIRKSKIRILVGDKVTMEVSKYDNTKGRITHRYKIQRTTDNE